jgi:hypothetical protein
MSEHEVDVFESDEDAPQDDNGNKSLILNQVIKMMKWCGQHKNREMIDLAKVLSRSYRERRSQKLPTQSKTTRNYRKEKEKRSHMFCLRRTKEEMSKSNLPFRNSCQKEVLHTLFSKKYSPLNAIIKIYLLIESQYLYSK